MKKVIMGFYLILSLGTFGWVYNVDFHHPVIEKSPDPALALFARATLLGGTWPLYWITEAFKFKRPEKNVDSSCK